MHNRAGIRLKLSNMVSKRFVIIAKSVHKAKENSFTLKIHTWVGSQGATKVKPKYRFRIFTNIFAIKFVFWSRLSPLISPLANFSFYILGFPVGYINFYIKELLYYSVFMFSYFFPGKKHDEKQIYGGKFCTTNNLLKIWV